MKHWKMAQKLGVGFGIVTTLVCLVGYIAFSALSSAATSIDKMAEAYVPASDVASNLLDDVRVVRHHIRLFEIFGDAKDYEEGMKYHGLMLQEFGRMEKISAANPDLKTLGTTVQAFPALYRGYGEMCAATARQINTIAGLLKVMLASAATAEKAMEELGHIVFTNQKIFHDKGNLDALLRGSDNLHLVSEAELLFKEIRRRYANARLTYDTSAQTQINALGAEALGMLKTLESQIIIENTRDQAQTAIAAITAYLTDMGNLLRGWEELNAISRAQQDTSTRLMELLETLNVAANKNAAAYASAAVNRTDASITRMSAITAGVVLLSIVLSILITRIITAPLRKSMVFAQAVAGGNLDERLDVEARDEIGMLADALRAMVDSLKGKIAEAGAQAAQAHKMGQEARAALEEARVAQEAAETAKRDGMLAAARQLEGIVAVVFSASTQLSTQVAHSEQGAATTSERIADAATAMEEMNATVLEVARSAGGAAGVSADARLKAEEGSRIVEDVVHCIGEVESQSSRLKTDMEQLGHQAEAIGAIMNVISDIADQTNLLALNAAIEAARAGEAGRGFAVVADEVRKLAEKTMQATVEVGNAIRGVQHSADQNMRSVDTAAQSIAKATALVQQAGDSLQLIVDLVESSADQIRTIATAAEQQSATSDEINRSLGTVSNAASETARAMGEAAQAVGDLTQQAQELTRLIEQMKRG